VARTYKLACPEGRLLVWRAVFLALGVFSFAAMLFVLLAMAIKSHT